MENDRKPLSGEYIHWQAGHVADGTGTPDEARELIAEFMHQARAGQVEPRLIEHLSDCFGAFLAGERDLLPAPEAGRFAPTRVPIESLDAAFGLTHIASGRPAIDREIRCAVAGEVLAKLLAGDSLEVAAEAVAAARREKQLPISSETEIRATWADHKLEGFLWLRVSRMPDPYTNPPPWTPEEVSRLTKLFRHVSGFVPY